MAGLKLDNNLIENTIRPLALGRKNYLFAGSDAGAQRLAMMYSFFGTCKALQVNPLAWLSRVLKIMPTANMSDLDSLLPGNLCRLQLKSVPPFQSEKCTTQVHAFRWPP